MGEDTPAQGYVDKMLTSMFIVAEPGNNLNAHQ